MATFDFSRYIWRQDDKVPGLYKREVGGGELIEDVWNFFKQGEQNLFLGVYLQVSQPLESSKFIDLARKAWTSLRWDVPTVASQILHEPREGSPMPAALLAYALPTGSADVDAWAKETVILKEGYKDLDALRYDIGRGIIPDKDLVPHTYLYGVPFSSTSFGFLLHTSHVPFDGAGVKIITTKLLEHLSKYITDPQYAAAEASRFKWGTENNHLLPIASEILRKHEPAEVDAAGNVVKPEEPEEPREGPKYLETLNENPPYDMTKDKPSNRRAGYTFSVEDSKKVIEACQKAADRLTVNHLAHGALSVLTVIDNPPAPGSPNVVFYYGLVDSRQRLAKEYRGASGYPGYCLGMSSIQVPVNLVDKYSGDVTNNLKAVIMDFAQFVKKEYKRQAAFPSLLAIENQQVEMMLSAPPPPPWCGPWFGGDGRGAIYLSPKYPQGSNNTVIEVTDFFVGLNKTDPGPFFRATEWNGRIMLSADYNEKAVEPEVVEGWMKKWAELMLAVC
ncbi:uncharacterized protein FOMMEDRAFT_93379 [Fomitiporia mediterranea MF3/22]|uniref:uncharacterized protein n=1 Tax=Fomitiporia mediterranea (strain MF3/22) TaxID=694068 RepID=UPI0004409647|nr:uncharacterized protein FOMMEDRAFT_93379 [Fomitiporia mediterranea MF3/22]EJC99631.1 hypothetical protein FOMMEDRAFT_93379 [Fomitiporia mediterranea MF3/22]